MITKFLSYLLIVHIFLFGSIFDCIEILHTYTSNAQQQNDHCCKDNHNEKIQSGTALQYTQEGTYKLIPPSLVSIDFAPIPIEAKRMVGKIFEHHIDKQSFFFTDTIRLLV